MSNSGIRMTFRRLGFSGSVVLSKSEDLSSSSMGSSISVGDIELDSASAGDCGKDGVDEDEEHLENLDGEQIEVLTLRGQREGRDEGTRTRWAASLWKNCVRMYSPRLRRRLSKSHPATGRS